MFQVDSEIKHGKRRKVSLKFNLPLRGNQTWVLTEASLSISIQIGFTVTLCLSLQPVFSLLILRPFIFFYSLSNILGLKEFDTTEAANLFQYL
jgi:hypothetical protein